MLFRRAVLVIHGFAGGTYDEEKLCNYLESKGYDVYSFTLPGHDKMLFNKVKKEEWIKSCEEHIEMLINYNYKRIYVIGHSMGGVLAAYLASKYKEINKIVLAAPAFKYLTFGENDFKFTTALINSPKLFKDYEKKEIISRFLHFPTSVIKEFMSLVKKSEKLPSKINIPTLLIQGNNDKIVPMGSSKYVYDNVKTNSKYLMILDGVNHDIFSSDKIDDVNKTINKFLRFGIYNDKN